MISAAIPGFTQEEFGFISGFAYTSVFVSTVFVAGIIADNCQRRLILGLAVMLWSACSITTALSTTLFQVKASRMFLGLFQAFCGVTSYSLIADYFPSKARTTAIAIFVFGNYTGGGLTSFSIPFIGVYGWRNVYLYSGVAGVVIGLLCLIVIGNPKRGRFEEVKPRKAQAAKQTQTSTAGAVCNFIKQNVMGFYETFTNKTCVFVLLGSMMRLWVCYVLAYFA